MNERPAASYKILVPPTREPVTIDDARDWCRIDITDDDERLAALISVARDYAETFTRRALTTQTILAAWDFFPGQGDWTVDPALLYLQRYAIHLPRPPLQTVTSLQYWDPAANALAVVSTSRYLVDAITEPGRVTPSFAMYWPPALPVPNAVQITYQAGYPTPAVVPAQIRQACLMLVAHWYANREPVGQATGEIALSVSNLLRSYKVAECY